MTRSGLAHMGGRSRHGTVFLVLGGAVALGLKAAAFVSAPSVPTIRRGVRLENGVQTIIRRGAAAAASTPQGADAAPAKAAAKPDDKDIDDAVLRMAMAMAEDEESPKPATGKAQEEGFDFSILVSLFWTALIIYSFGSSFIAISQGRMQDRTGGDFTAYDFFDNIFAFKEWSFEYTLGFDPFKVWAQMTGGKPPEPADLDL